jgi:hypothetical protein
MQQYQIAASIAEDETRQTGFEVISRDDDFIDRPVTERPGDRSDDHVWWLIVACRPDSPRPLTLSHCGVVEAAVRLLAGSIPCSLSLVVGEGKLESNICITIILKSTSESHRKSALENLKIGMSTPALRGASGTWKSRWVTVC